MSAARPGPPDVAPEPGRLRERLKRALVRRFSLRVHMTCILAATLGAGALASKLFLLLGVQRLALRWALAVVASYGVFFGLVRLWAVLVHRAERRALAHRAADLAEPGALDLAWGGGRGGGGGSGGELPFGGGGGGFGGGGASASFEGDAPALVASSGGGGGGGGSASGGGSGSWGGLSIDLDDGVVIVIVLAVLALVVAGAGGYVIWMAPDIFAETLFEVALAGPLASRMRRVAADGWAESLLHATYIPFLVVLVAATGAGWMVHRFCPGAVSASTAVRACVLSLGP